ncbi:MAG: hypothetical protein HY378_00200 [Candidatus Brennerbacteria bacterium]|nr:hypothetical protein [Candidatus Brennerbacteria bacterium]
MLEKFLRFSKKYLIPRPIFRLIQPAYHYLLAFLGSFFYGAPSRKIFVIGVTGTKGKTTALELMNAVLEAGGKKTAIFSSTTRKISGKREKNPTETTMPGRFALQKFFREAVGAGCEYALIEVTSEGVTKYRHRFIHWDAAVFLNIHPEHIEAHGSFEEYLKAKLDFFRELGRSSKKKRYFFINEDDARAPAFEKAVRSVKGGVIAGFSENDVRPLAGGNPQLLFNLPNAAAALALARVLGIEEGALRAFRNFKGLPGRLEFVQKEPFGVVIDYAHTPDSLERLYKFLGNQRLICVLGSAGGGRDKWKRPELGRIAARHCDEIILTNEDPYDENPKQILSQIKSGISNSQFLISNVHEIIDRREAIKKAVSLAKKDDMVVITGKGSEEWIHVAGGKKIPWNDRKVVEEILGK